MRGEVVSGLNTGCGPSVLHQQTVRVYRRRHWDTSYCRLLSATENNNNNNNNNGHVWCVCWLQMSFFLAERANSALQIPELCGGKTEEKGKEEEGQKGQREHPSKWISGHGLEIWCIWKLTMPTMSDTVTALTDCMPTTSLMHHLKSHILKKYFSSVHLDFWSYFVDWCIARPTRLDEGLNN